MYEDYFKGIEEECFIREDSGGEQNYHLERGVGKYTIDNRNAIE